MGILGTVLDTIYPRCLGCNKTLFPLQRRDDKTVTEKAPSKMSVDGTMTMTRHGHVHARRSCHDNAKYNSGICT